jgi:epoxyqueuosine reductase
LNAVQLSRTIKTEAARLGFSQCHIASIAEATHADFYEAWLAQGRAGEMTYLERNVDKRRNPALMAENDGPDEQPFRSIIVLAVNHYQLALAPDVRQDPSLGIIASYAWGDDYHEIIRPQLHALDAFIAGSTGRTIRGKCLVDTGPVLERDWALRTGLGFTGKNCCTIHPKDGSWLVLATVMVPELLAPDPQPEQINGQQPSTDQVIAGLPSHEIYGTWSLPQEVLDADSEDEFSYLAAKIGTCGRCSRCLDACPTDAFVGPFHLDPQRCISYWTIESRGPIPRKLRSSFSNRIFGCDICQEVCPWNQRLEERQPLLAGLQAKPSRLAPPLLEGFAPDTPYWLNQNAFSTHFRRSPIKRANRAGMLRNVCVALGNWADPSAVPALQQALSDEHTLARGHAAWALGQILVRHQHPIAEASLNRALTDESDSWVTEEIRLALQAR